MTKRIFNLRNVAKMTVACLAAAIFFASCEETDDPITGDTFIDVD